MQTVEQSPWDLIDQLHDQDRSILTDLCTRLEAIIERADHTINRIDASLGQYRAPR